MKPYESLTPGMLLSPTVVASILGLDPGLLAEWRAQKIGLPWIKLGTGKTSPVRYLASDVDAFIKARRVQVKRLAHITPYRPTKRIRKAAEPPPSFSAPPDRESP